MLEIFYMANFSPKWDLVLDSNIIIEGQSTYARLRLSKQDVNDIQYLCSINRLQCKFDMVM